MANKKKLTRRFFQQKGRIGGQKSAKNLTKEERIARAKKASSVAHKKSYAQETID